jgi:hypothetical protein
VQVKDGLSAINPGICDEAVAALVNPFFFGEFRSGGEKMSH